MYAYEYTYASIFLVANVVPVSLFLPLLLSFSLLLSLSPPPSLSLTRTYAHTCMLHAASAIDVNVVLYYVLVLHTHKKHALTF